MARSLVQNGLASQLCRVASALFFFSITGASQHVHPKKREGKKFLRIKRRDIFSIDFEVFRSSFIAFIVSIVSFLHCSSIYNARRWIDVCMCVYYVCFVWLFFGTFALLVQQISSSNGGIVGISIESTYTVLLTT